MKKNIIIYPITARTVFLVRYLAEKYNVIPVEASGSGYKGKDVGYINGQFPLGIKVRGNIEESILCPGILFITNDFIKIRNYNGLYNKILQEKSSELEIVMSDELNENMGIEKKDNLLHWAKHLKKIESPIIAVGGIVDDFVNTEIAINLYRYLSKKYTVEVILGESEAACLGMNYWDKTVYTELPSEVEKIKYFNYLISEIEEKKAPEIMIIQIPGGMIRLSDKWLNDCGIFYYYISQAVNVDFFICTVPHEFLDSELLKKISDDICGKYNFKIDVVNISNKILDWNTEESKEELDFCYGDIGGMKIKNEQNGICIIDVKSNMGDYDVILKRIEEKLGENDNE